MTSLLRTQVGGLQHRGHMTKTLAVSSALPPAACRAGASTAEKRCDGAHRDRDDPRAEDVGQQRVLEGHTANALAHEVRVRDLERHPDREGEVGEVPVVGSLVSRELDAARRRAVVDARVAEDKHRVHRRPREPHAQERERGEQTARGSDAVTSLVQGEPHGHQARSTGADEDGLTRRARASSARAVRSVSPASKPPTVTHTHTTNTVAPTSEAQRAATDHVAPRATATAAATRPLPYPTITRLAASPEWSGGAVETGGPDARTA